MKKTKNNYKPSKEELMAKFKELCDETFECYKNPEDVIKHLLDGMFECFGTVKTNDGISHTLDNYYVQPDELECFLGKTDFGQTIPLVSKNLLEVQKMEALEKLINLDIKTLDKIVGEYNL